MTRNGADTIRQARGRTTANHVRLADPAGWIAAGPRPSHQAPPADLPEPPLDEGWAERPLLAHLAALAARQPDALAIADGTHRLTFAALYEASCRIGAAIRAAGWSDGAVGVLLPNDARYLIAMFGCSAAGRPCMMLGPHLPGPFLDRVVDSAALVGVVATPELAERLGGAVPVLALEAALASPPQPPVLAESLFIVSTSGTTGEPKAVVIPLRTFLPLSAQRIRQLRIGPHDRVAAIGAPATSGALAQRLYPLLGGASLLLPDPHALGLGRALDLVRQEGATVLHATPQLLKVLAGLPAGRAAFAGLRMAMMGGDALLHADLATIRAALPPGCRVSYGISLTESTRVASWFVPEDDRYDPLRVASGYIAEGVEVMVQAEDGTPLPPGEAGELVVRTPFGAAGDWVGGRIVASRFPVDPVDPSRRIVHTGDIVRLSPDGVMVVLGRRDRMVKLAGQRVEPATIEMAMRAIPGIADAAVVAQHQPGEVRLLGFVVPGPDAPAEEALLPAVRAALRTALPVAMVPAKLHVIPALPLTASGKRDDRALAALAGP